MEKMIIDWSNMDKYIADPIEYRFIDKVEVLPGKEAFGRKSVSSQDWYFAMGDSNDPMMPSGFLMEAMMQTGVFIITTLPEKMSTLMMFQSCEHFELYNEIRPGDVIKTHVTLNSYSHGLAGYFGEVRGGIDDELVCTMSFTLVSEEFLKLSSRLNK